MSGHRNVSFNCVGVDWRLCFDCMYIYFVIFSTKGETVRYPRVKQFAHFHYDHVEFDTIQVRTT